MLRYKCNNLVISAVGDRSLHRHWGKGNFDRCLIYYGSGTGYRHQSEHYFEIKGSKFHLIHDVLDKLPPYDFYWLPDDDVYLDVAGVNKLFDIMKQYGLLLGQPSLIGWYGVQINLHQRNSILRYTNFVEIMCPCFSKVALQKCRPYFKENITGWSYDALWNKLLNNPERGIAIIDDVVAVHTRPVFGGDLYRNQQQTDPEAFALGEARALVDKYKLSANSENNTDHGELIESEIYALVQYAQVKATRKPFRDERFWPSSELLKTAIQSLSTASS